MNTPDQTTVATFRRYATGEVVADSASLQWPGHISPFSSRWTTDKSPNAHIPAKELSAPFPLQPVLSDSIGQTPPPSTGCFGYCPNMQTEAQSPEIRPLRVDGVVFAMLDRAHDDSYQVGHVWIEWLSTVEGQRAFRGFYPDFSKISAELQAKLQSSTDEWFKFFPTTAVPGRFERDIHAQELRERKIPVFAKDFELQDAERTWLDRRCFIPPGRDHVPEGLYSWNEDKPEEHNCSSWAIVVINHTKDNPEFTGIP